MAAWLKQDHCGGQSVLLRTSPSKLGGEDLLPVPEPMLTVKGHDVGRHVG